MNKKRVRRFYTAKETRRNSIRDGVHERMESKEGEDDFIVTTFITSDRQKNKGNTRWCQNTFLWSQD